MIWPGYHDKTAYLLGAFLVDMLERVLCLFLVIPHKVGMSCELSRLGITRFLNGVDVANVMFPGARRRRPLLLLLGTLCNRCRWGRGGFCMRHGWSSFALLTLGFGPAANLIKILPHDVDSTPPGHVSGASASGWWGWVHVALGLPGLILGKVPALPLDAEDQLALRRLAAWGCWKKRRHLDKLVA